MLHRPPAIRRTLDKQSRHTGKRDIRISGAPQRRQSAGKRVANRLSAAPVRPERAAASTLEPAVNPVRSRSVLLLKTTLRHRLRLLPAQAGRIKTSIATGQIWRNRLSASE